LHKGGWAKTKEPYTQKRHMQITVKWHKRTPLTFKLVEAGGKVEGDVGTQFGAIQRVGVKGYMQGACRTDVSDRKKSGMWPISYGHKGHNWGR